MAEQIITKRDEVKGLLRKLFRSDQADLDFGIYRIMNFKRKEIERFIDHDLIEYAESEFRDYSRVSTTDLERELEEDRKRIEGLLGSGVFNASGDPVKYLDVKAVQGYEEKRKALKEVALTEEQVNDVFNHVYEFFSRYYEDGDFIPKTRYGGRDKYYIPYNGEEVALHWATKDMYYVKTGEYFKKYSFKAGSFTVTFRLVEAKMETGNVKGEKKFFMLADKEPVKPDEENNSVEVRFNYRGLSEEETRKHGTRNLQSTLVTEALERIRFSLESSSIAGILWPRAGEDQSLMDKHLNAYVDRNTKDFFIHKDLKGFLERELDFYLKNEVWNIDELDTLSQFSVKTISAKVKAIRNIALKVVEFLNQIESFQKKLFEKKKFVLSTDYCITLDLIPEEFYEEIGKNEKQVAEWKKLYKLDEITNNTFYGTKEKSNLSVDFLNQYKYMALDTKFFSFEFNDKLFERIENVDEFIEGLLIKSENWQALKLLMNKYENEIKNVYIDPPYNTGSDDFLYKDDYKNSSWISMLYDRILLGKNILSEDGVFLVSIDDRELFILRNIMNTIFKNENFISNFIWNTEGHTDNQFQVKINHEYILAFCKNLDFIKIGYVVDPNIREESNLWKGYAENSITKNGPVNPPSEVILPVGFPCEIKEAQFEPTNCPKDFFKDIEKIGYITREITKKYNVDYPIRLNKMVINDNKLLITCRVYSGWANLNKLKEFIENNFQPLEEEDGNIIFYLSEKGVIYYKKERHKTRNVLSVLRNMSTTEKMRSELEHMDLIYSYPKPKELLKYLIKVGTDYRGIVLDYFAGSGTTAQAIIEMKRNKEANCKYILIEQAEHFNKVILPRIKKNNIC